MKRRLASFLRRLGNRKASRRPDEAGFLTRAPLAAPDWLPEYQGAWQTFLLSPAGAALLERGRAIHFESARKACADVFHTSHSAGCAQGFGECLDWLESLSRASRVPDASLAGAHPPETDTRPPGEAALREHMSP